MDDFFNSLGGKRSNYTMEEIEEAKKRQKSNGKTFMENLGSVRAEKTGNADAARKAMDEMDKAIRMTADDINSTLKDLNDNLKSDFDFKTGETGSAGVTASAPGGETAVFKSTSEALDRFAGIEDVINEKVFGQDEYIHKLVIAFKRPLVSQRDENDALNSIFITGPACSGRHFSLGVLAEELCKRQVLSSGEIYRMDLSIYPTAAEDKLFLQDLYSALMDRSQVIVFENMEACHVSMLTRLADLVTTGECRLSERYTMQKGTLTTVTNALAGETVGALQAKGKYLVFVSSGSLDKLAGIMGAPFVNALGDVCTTHEPDAEAVNKIADVKREQLTDKVKNQLSYILDTDASFVSYAAAQTSKSRGLKGVLDTYDDTLRALAELRLERDDLAGATVRAVCEDGEPAFVIGEEKILMSSFAQTGYNGEEEAVERELDDIVGLDMVKEYIRSLKEYYAMQKRRREEGLKAGELNKHMIFTGNPGTGKTTIARIVSKYLKAIGVLSGGQLVEVSRGDLVGRYVGHTAPLVGQVIKSALGGVLFIDEAYSLYRGEDDTFGLEAIDTLVKGIEDNRDNLIVILAGYSKEMEDFLESNSGLKSRFPNIIDFPDYTGEELTKIAKITAKSKGYEIDDEVLAPMQEFFDHIQATNAREAGNGRLVRNKVEEAILNQSKRLVAEPDANISLLMLMDFELE